MTAAAPAPSLFIAGVMSERDWYFLGVFDSQEAAGAVTKRLKDTFILSATLNDPVMPLSMRPFHETDQ